MRVGLGILPEMLGVRREPSCETCLSSKVLGDSIRVTIREWYFHLYSSYVMS